MRRGRLGEQWETYVAPNDLDINNSRLLGDAVRIRSNGAGDVRAVTEVVVERLRAVPRVVALDGAAPEFGVVGQDPRI